MAGVVISVSFWRPGDAEEPAGLDKRSPDCHPHQFQNGYFAALREIVIAAQQLSQKNRGDSQDGVKKTSE